MDVTYYVALPLSAYPRSFVDDRALDSSEIRRRMLDWQKPAPPT